jgi:hypothetical protein
LPTPRPKYIEAEKFTRRTGVSVLARARAWNGMLGKVRGVSTRADLAAHLGVTRAMVTQSLAVLAASPPVLAAIESADAAGHVVTEGVWRRIRHLPPEAALYTLACHMR